jgi:hypothetical protein
VGSGGISSLTPLEWPLASPEVDVAGDDDDPRAKEFKVDEDLRRGTPLPFCPFAWPLPFSWTGTCFSSVLMLARLFLRKLERKEGMAQDDAAV